ncbi:MAG: lycopene cyclase domain-containing protein [Candidatus Sericytochromatia bacterium]|nr:lycopene cyclase domain-containing protein [Candidatus Sericytochromatia bacterium]
MYAFLVLCLLLAVPALLVWLARPDLRAVAGRMALVSLPFAGTERLFYPTYWEPRFVGDLVNRIGFGVEDVLFVTALAVFTSVGWAAVAGVRLVGAPVAGLAGWRRGGALMGACFVAVAGAWARGWPMIHVAPALMAAAGCLVCWRRPDLWGPGLGSAVLTTFVYTALCLALQALLPGVFALAWHAERFSNVFVAGVPLEELGYAAGAGWIGAVFYPFVAGLRWEKLR